MSDEIRFTVLGNPIPKARARVTIKAGQKAHAFTPTRTRDWEARVKDAARPAMVGHRLFTGPVAVELWLWRGDRRRCDGDNLEKALTPKRRLLIIVRPKHVFDDLINSFYLIVCLGVIS